MKITKMLILSGALAAVSTAMALPVINGDIIFAGTYATDNSDLTVATKFTSFSNVQVIGSSSGSYALVPANYGSGVGESVTYNAFTFDPTSTSLPVTPLWTFSPDAGVTTYSFDLSSLAIDTRSVSGLHLVGSGTAHITGYQDTPGQWDLSIGETGKFHFSAGNAVPDGGATAMLLGTGFLALGLLRRKSA